MNCVMYAASMKCNCGDCQASRHLKLTRLPAAPITAEELAEMRHEQFSSGAVRSSVDHPDMINAPPHYLAHPSGVECITIARHMPYNIGAAIKYLWRCEHKGAHVDDLKKAAFYIADEIKRIQDKEARS